MGLKPWGAYGLISQQLKMAGDLTSRKLKPQSNWLGLNRVGPITLSPIKKATYDKFASGFQRRGQDSNLRTSYPVTDLANPRFRPLSHLSGCNDSARSSRYDTRPDTDPGRSLILSVSAGRVCKVSWPSRPFLSLILSYILPGRELPFERDSDKRILGDIHEAALGASGGRHR